MSIDTKWPTIQMATEWGLELFFVCPDCGSLVKDVVNHGNMHREQKQISEGVKALRDWRNGS